MTKAVSLASLNARKASSEAVEFEYVDEAGERTGIFLSILGAQSDKVTSEVNALVNDRRRKEAALAATRMGGRDQPTFTPIEDDIAFGHRLAAVRLEGWRGIEEPFTPENALSLCQNNADIADFITKKSNLSGPFMKRSPKA